MKLYQHLVRAWKEGATEFHVPSMRERLAELGPAPFGQERGKEEL